MDTGNDPFLNMSESAEWKCYSDVKNLIIENAYQTNKNHGPEKQRTSDDSSSDSNDDVDHFDNSLYNGLHSDIGRIGFTLDWKN
ncbi:unnamed protein product [Adineta steineri]|uniref:Uncharacterized protein n=1 Tax=Adineta steineri TaxID=433720 RepID=A0A816D1V8_9BILA|nr:unnamed protein product [Adineta steineri]CAF1629746.1 unnamed protein product [Adineta steineri]